MKSIINLSILLLLLKLISSSNGQQLPTPSTVTIDSILIPNLYDYRINGTGYFGYDPQSHINITIGNDLNQLYISYINSTYFRGSPVTDLMGYHDVRIFNKTTNEMLYYGKNMYYSQSVTTMNPFLPPLQIYDQPLFVNGNNYNISAHGYFGDSFIGSFEHLNFTVLDINNNQERPFIITFINSSYIEGIAPSGFNGSQIFRINKRREIVYDFTIYYVPASSSGSYETPTPSDSYETPTPTPSDSYETPTPSDSYETPTPSDSYETPTPSDSYETPTPSITPTPTPIITCEYSSYGFVINSTERIECKGRGQTYCETGLGSTCSTDSNNSTIKCTTGRSGSSSFYCIGNNIECTSSYVTCSIKKPQSSYLLVNGVEQKSNYYDHSKQQDEEYYNSNNNNNSSSASIIYSSLSVILLLSVLSIFF